MIIYSQATECLIELGADVNIGEGSSTPLYIAVCNKREDVVKLIIKQVNSLKTLFLEQIAGFKKTIFHELYNYNQFSCLNLQEGLSQFENLSR